MSPSSRCPRLGGHTLALASPSTDDADHLHQPDDRRCDHREQPGRETIVLANNPESFHPTNPVLDMNPRRSHLPILLALLGRQLATSRLAMRHLDVLGAVVAFVALLGRLRELLAHIALDVDRLV